MFTLSNLIPFIFFIITFFWVKPWRKTIESDKLLYLLFIDSFSLSKLFNLNFYKIFSLFKIKSFLNSDFRHKFIFIFLLTFTFLSGLLFILLNPDVRDPNSNSLIDLPLFRIFRHLFTLTTTFIFSYQFYLCIKNEPLEKFFRPLEIIGYIISSGIFLEMIFKIDFYALLSGGRALVYGTDYLRARGFSYEPRGAAQVLCFCLTSCIYFSNYRSTYFYILFLSLALFFTKAFSGFIILTFLYLLIFSRALIIKNYKQLKIVIFATVIFITLFCFFLKLGLLQQNIKERSFVFSSMQSDKFIDLAINKLEVFDAAYVNFLRHNPAYIITGTGAGMGGFASQDYVLEKDLYIFPNGSTSLPLMGAVYLISQFGAIISFVLIFISVSKFSTLANKDLFYFILILVSFLLQYYYFLPIILCNLLLDTSPHFPKLKRR